MILLQIKSLALIPFFRRNPGIKMEIVQLDNRMYPNGQSDWRKSQLFTSENFRRQEVEAVNVLLDLNWLTNRHSSEKQMFEALTFIQIIRRLKAGFIEGEFCRRPDEPFEDTIAIKQYIQQQIRMRPDDIQNIITPLDFLEEEVWKYEHLRQFCMELNGLAARLQEECLIEECSKMTDTEGRVSLCTAHKTPKDCTAIDFISHTLDEAASELSSNKHFPKKVCDSSVKELSEAKLEFINQRLQKKFSHSYYCHRHVFYKFESETYLYRRFSKFVTKYNLIEENNLIVPIFEEVNSNQKA